jgi:6-phosphogluconate dehydrogenase
MKNTQPQQRYENGMVGLGVMGRNLLLNMADHSWPLPAELVDQEKAKTNPKRRLPS